MVDFTPIYAAKQSASDEEVFIGEWSTGYVKKGEVIGRGESAKATFNIEAPRDGYLYPFVSSEDVSIGQVIAVISGEKVRGNLTLEDALPFLPSQPIGSPEPPISQDVQLHDLLGIRFIEEEPPQQLVATRKAKMLATRHGIELSGIETKGTITEKDVLQFIDRQFRAVSMADDHYLPERPQRLLLIGGGKGAVQVIDALARLPGQLPVMIMDDDQLKWGRKIMGVPIVSGVSVDAAEELFRDGQWDAAVIAVSTSIDFRRRTFKEWRSRWLPFANVIHPSAIVGTGVAMGQGNVVLALCHIGPCAKIGDNSFLSTYCNIEHHCTLGDHCTFGPGVMFSSKVTVEDGVKFGSNVTVEPFLTIGGGSVVASGSVITISIVPGAILKATPTYTMR